MKCTKIRMNGKKLNEKQMITLVELLNEAIKNCGFISNAVSVNSSRINISGNKCSFTIDPNVHGYNTRIHNGYRTRTPSWGQRVAFNNIINTVFTLNKISSNVVSGDFIVRQGLHSYTEDNWYEQKPGYMHRNESLGYSVEEGYDNETN